MAVCGYIYYCIDIVFVGFVTNGEFNSLRASGYKRPVSVFKIRSDARSKYSNKGEATLLAMLTPRSMSNVHVQTMYIHVSIDLSNLSCRET